jgi:tight adherence protein B
VRRRLALVGLALLAATVALPAAGAAGAKLKLTTSAAHFPDRVYAVSLPTKRNLTTAAVTVTENGEPVNKLAVVSANSAGASGTVLLIDASNSMRGEPVISAMKAARVFAARNPGQPLAAIAFNDLVTPLLGFTRDQSKVSAALAKVPKNREGTHIYDAVAEAVRQLSTAGYRAGRIVLLSDGQEVRSKVTRAAALSAAQAAGVRIYTVGLKSYAFDSAYLESLARDTGGTYAQATSSAQLAHIYDQLGFQFANEYLLLYRSLAKPKQTVDVAIRVQGYGTTLHDSYTSPALGLNVKPFQRSTWSKVLVSWWFMLLIVVVSIWLLSWGVWTMLDARRRTLRTRMARFVELEPLDEGLSRERWLQRISVFAESLESRGRFFKRFAERCELAGIETPPGPLLLGATVVGLALGVLLSAVWSPLFLLLIVIAPMVVLSYVSFRLKRVRKRFGDQLPDNLDVLASALRAGHSLVGALAVMARDAHEPSKREFEQVTADEQLGIPLDESLKRVGARMENPDMAQVALIALLQRETGSSSAEVIDQVSTNIRGRMDVRRLVRTLTAQGRLARWIVSLMPPAMLFAVSLAAPGYLHPLFHQTLGIVFVVVGATMVVIGWFVIKRIVEIKV